jgi:hypothetical protein
LRGAAFYPGLKTIFLRGRFSSGSGGVSFFFPFLSPRREDHGIGDRPGTASPLSWRVFLLRIVPVLQFVFKKRPARRWRARDSSYLSFLLTPPPTQKKGGVSFCPPYKRGATRGHKVLGVYGLPCYDITSQAGIWSGCKRRVLPIEVGGERNLTRARSQLILSVSTVYIVLYICIYRQSAVSSSASCPPCEHGRLFFFSVLMWYTHRFQTLDESVSVLDR